MRHITALSHCLLGREYVLGLKFVHMNLERTEKRGSGKKTCVVMLHTLEDIQCTWPAPSVFLNKVRACHLEAGHACGACEFITKLSVEDRNRRQRSYRDRSSTFGERRKLHGDLGALLLERLVGS